MEDAVKTRSPVDGDYQTLHDWRGNEIKIGSEIIYVVVHSSSVELVEAHVIDIRPVSYNSNFGIRRHKDELVVQPTKRNSHGWIRSDEEKAQVVRAIERVTVIG